MGHEERHEYWRHARMRRDNAIRGRHGWHQRLIPHRFSGAESFNQPIGKWNVALITDIDYTFRGAAAQRLDASTRLSRGAWTRRKNIA